MGRESGARTERPPGFPRRVLTIQDVPEVREVPHLREQSQDGKGNSHEQSISNSKSGCEVLTGKSKKEHGSSVDEEAHQRVAKTGTRTWIRDRVIALYDAVFKIGKPWFQPQRHCRQHLL